MGRPNTDLRAFRDGVKYPDLPEIETEEQEATDCPNCGYTQSRGVAGTHYDVVHNSLTGGLRCIRCEHEWAVV